MQFKLLTNKGEQKLKLKLLIAFYGL